MLKNSSEKKRMWVAATAAATAWPSATANPVSAIMVVPAARVASRSAIPTSSGTMPPRPKQPLSGSEVCHTDKTAGKNKHTKQCGGAHVSGASLRADTSEPTEMTLLHRKTSGGPWM